MSYLQRQQKMSPSHTSLTVAGSGTALAAFGLGFLSDIPVRLMGVVAQRTLARNLSDDCQALVAFAFVYAASYVLAAWRIYRLRAATGLSSPQKSVLLCAGVLIALGGALVALTTIGATDARTFLAPTFDIRPKLADGAIEFAAIRMKVGFGLIAFGGVLLAVLGNIDNPERYDRSAWFRARMATLWLAVSVLAAFGFAFGLAEMWRIGWGDVGDQIARGKEMNESATVAIAEATIKCCSIATFFLPFHGAAIALSAQCRQERRPRRTNQLPIEGS